MRWKAVKLRCSAKPKARRQLVTVRDPTASSAPVASAAVVERVRRENAIKKGASQMTKRGGRLRSGRTMMDLRGYVGAAGLNKAEAGWIASAANHPTLAPGLASQSRDTGKVEKFLARAGQLLPLLLAHQMLEAQLLGPGLTTPEPNKSHA